MLPYSIYYENTCGDTVRFDTLPFVAVSSELFDSGWSFATSPRPLGEGGRLISRRRSTNERSMTVQLAAENARALADALDRLASVSGYDLMAMSPGRLWVNGSYLRCYLVSSEKSLSPDFPGMGEMRISVLPEVPAWCTERTYHTFTADTGGVEYPYRYPYRYGSGRSSLEIFNDTGGPCPMIIRFSGAVSNPRISVGGRTVGIDVTLGENEYAVIDQLSRLVYSVSAQGERTNCFDRRVRGGVCFEYLPAGSTRIDAPGGMVEITVISMRSEPLWSN